jgi:hypothetical protein
VLEPFPVERLELRRRGAFSPHPDMSLANPAFV